MYTRGVMRQLKITLYDTHSAYLAYYCDIKRDFDAMFYMLYSQVTAID